MRNLRQVRKFPRPWLGWSRYFRLFPFWNMKWTEKLRNLRDLRDLYFCLFSFILLGVSTWGIIGKILGSCRGRSMSVRLPCELWPRCWIFSLRSSIIATPKKIEQQNPTEIVMNYCSIWGIQNCSLSLRWICRSSRTTRATPPIPRAFCWRILRGWVTVAAMPWNWHHGIVGGFFSWQENPRWAHGHMAKSMEISQFWWSLSFFSS